MKKEILTTSGIPHARYALIDVHALTTLVNNHLTACCFCGEHGVVFSVHQYNGLSNYCKVSCPSCNDNRLKIRRQKNRLKGTLELDGVTPLERKKSLRRIRILEANLVDMNDDAEQKSRTHPQKTPLFLTEQVPSIVRGEGGKISSSSKTSILHDSLNLQVFLSTFANGGGFKEAQCTLAHLDAPNLEGMRGAYNSKLEDICRSIRDTTSCVVYSGLLEEIEAVIGEQLSDKKKDGT